MVTKRFPGGQNGLLKSYNKFDADRLKIVRENQPEIFVFL